MQEARNRVQKNLPVGAPLWEAIIMQNTNDYGEWIFRSKSDGKKIQEEQKIMQNDFERSQTKSSFDSNPELLKKTIPCN
jgi:hypothetical protein